jgi:hypothetical protein
MSDFIHQRDLFANLECSDATLFFPGSSSFALHEQTLRGSLAFSVAEKAKPSLLLGREE